MREESEKRKEGVTSSLVIEDSHGREQFTSIEEFNHDRFESDTTEIINSFNFGKSMVKGLRVTIHFASWRVSSYVTISNTGVDSKRDVKAIEAEIYTILRRSGTLNSWFQHFAPLGIFSFLLMILVATKAIQRVTYGKTLDAILDDLVLGNSVLLLVYFAMAWLSPYSMIDTPANTRKEGWRTFLIFSIVLSFLLKLGLSWVYGLLTGKAQ